MEKVDKPRMRLIALTGGLEYDVAVEVLGQQIIAETESRVRIFRIGLRKSILGTEVNAIQVLYARGRRRGHGRRGAVGRSGR